MINQKNAFNKIFLTVIVIAGWVAILFQFYLIVLHRNLSIPGTIVQFFSYFTILTNIVVAVCCTLVLLKPTSRWGKFFSQPGVLTAVALYISVVGLVYNLVLRFLWAPQGLQKIVDELLHSVIPILFLIYWLLFVQKAALQWKNAFYWLLFPFIYSIYILCRGAFTGLYPYPFMDVVVLGYKQVLLNSGYLAGVFLLIAILFIGIGKMFTRYRNKPERFQ
jgi:hypothetical protein